MSRRSDVLTLAVLGLLQDSPMHGYELRKRLSGTLGAFRALSYGSLYPCLKELQARGWIDESDQTAALPHALSGKRARIVYQLTADGKEHFAGLLSQTGPSSWEDDGFDVRFAFFSRLDADARLRILEGRRSRVQERLDAFSQSVARTRERWDDYTLELQQHGLESVEREVRWLDARIDHERHGRAPSDPTSDPGSGRHARRDSRPHTTPDST